MADMKEFFSGIRKQFSPSDVSEMAYLLRDSLPGKRIIKIFWMFSSLHKGFKGNLLNFTDGNDMTIKCFRKCHVMGYYCTYFELRYIFHYQMCPIRKS